jgi:hypothetical protein
LVEALGPIKFILVPNGWHRRDAPAYKQRYPEAKILCPAFCKSLVENVVKVDSTVEEAVERGELPGLKYLSASSEKGGM